MTRPENERARPGRRPGNSETDLQGSETNFSLTQPTDIEAEAQAGYLGCLMHVVDPDAARRLLLSTEPRTWARYDYGVTYDAAALTIAAGILPDALLVAAQVRRTGLPAVVRHRITMCVFELSDTAPPAALADHYRALVVRGAVAQHVRVACEVVHAATFVADLDELAELVAREFGAISWPVAA